MTTPTRHFESTPLLATAVDGVVTHHRNGFRSGVARFNELLAQSAGVPLLALSDPAAARLEQPLLSFKFSELGEPERRALEDLAERPTWGGTLYLHEFAALPLEEKLIQRADHVHCGNHEVLARVRPLQPSSSVAWTPGLVVDDRRFTPTGISVFSFGMAHKLRTDMFHKLRTLLDRGPDSYSVFVSAANHETASLADAQVVFEEMHQIFPKELYFLGNLSDVAVHNQLLTTTFFAAFFEGGVRSNNTSVASALERGAVVITNLDEFSPPEYVHMDNVVDIQQIDVLPSDPLVLRQISVRAMETGRARSWDRLRDHLAGRSNSARFERT